MILSQHEMHCNVFAVVTEPKNTNEFKYGCSNLTNAIWEGLMCTEHESIYPFFFIQAITVSEFYKTFDIWHFASSKYIETIALQKMWQVNAHLWKQVVRIHEKINSWFLLVLKQQ